MKKPKNKKNIATKTIKANIFEAFTVGGKFEEEKYKISPACKLLHTTKNHLNFKQTEKNTHKKNGCLSLKVEEEFRLRKMWKI